MLAVWAGEVAAGRKEMSKELEDEMKTDHWSRALRRVREL